MGLTCGGKEVEMSREDEEKIVAAMQELQEEQEKLIKSEKELQEQMKRKHWHDLTGWEKLKTLLGWDPNGGL